MYYCMHFALRTINIIILYKNTLYKCRLFGHLKMIKAMKTLFSVYLRLYMRFLCKVQHNTKNYLFAYKTIFMNFLHK